MTSSLVGSEMCIRDRLSPRLPLCPGAGVGLLPGSGLPELGGSVGSACPVSYTHLTLPTSVDLGGR
eukprot:11527422-Prorocentrum_lima.AAC.1